MSWGTEINTKDDKIFLEGKEEIKNENKQRVGPRS